MTRGPRNHTPAFKAKVALAALEDEKTLPSWRSSSTCMPTGSRNGAVNSWRVPPMCLVTPARRHRLAAPRASPIFGQ